MEFHELQNTFFSSGIHQLKSQQQKHNNTITYEIHVLVL